MAPSTSATEYTGAGSLLDAIQEFRDRVPWESLNYFRVFLQVMRKPGVSQSEMMKLMPDLAMPGTISVLCRKLTKIGDGDRSIDLLRLEENPEDRRYKCVYLTATGRQLADRIAKYLV